MGDESGRREPEDSGHTRKQFLRGAAGAGVLLGTGGVLAACGGGGKGSTVVSTVPDVPIKRKRGGVLRVGLAGGGPQGTFDPHRMVIFTDWAHAFNLYELLTRGDPATLAIKNHLAEEITPNAQGDVWTVRLRQGVEFHNGKTLSAEDLIFSAQRMVMKDTNTAIPLAFVDGKGLKKLDDRTVRFTLHKPYSDFPAAFAASNEFIVPVGFDPKHPVGTGPFKLVSSKPGERAEFAPHPNYWGEGPYVDKLIAIAINDDDARVNALKSGQIDAMQALPLTQLAELKGSTKLRALSYTTVGWNPITMRVDLKPYSDNRVRQAFRLIADRKQILEQALLGQGSIGNDLYMQFDPDYAHDLPQREQDIPKAKALLKQAGYDNDLRVELTTFPGAPGLVETCEVFAEQAKAAGVTVKVRKLESQVFQSIENGYFRYPFAVDTNISTFSYLTTCAAWDASAKSPFNETHWDDPKFKALYAAATTTLDAAKRKEIIHAMQEIQYTQGGYIVYAFSNVVDAYSTKVVGYQPDKSGWPLSTFAFNRLSFA